MTSLLARLRDDHRLAAALVAAVVAVVALALWLTQPWLLLVDAEVDEAFPVAATEAVVDGSATPSATVGPSPATATPSTGPSGDDAVTGATPSGADGPGDEAAPISSPSASPSPSPTPTGPEPLLAGEFVSRDHDTSGTATVYRLEDGSLTLRIEDLATDNGPDLFVYLDDDAADAAEDAFDDGRSLGRLKGNQGNQNYQVPDDVDLDGVASVVIWCDRFSSAFGAVDLLPVG